MDTREAQGRPPEWHPEMTERDRVNAWRLRTLIDAGYPVAAAERIAARTDVDLHKAVELVKAGCDPATAADILL